MKLHFGALPENPDFDPIEGGWVGIREPGPVLLQLLAIPTAIIITVLVVGLLYLVWPPRAIIEPGALIILYLLAFLPLHELLHAVCFPGGLRSSNTLIGVWPTRLLFYAFYEGEISRNRFLVALAAPFVGLTLIPIAIIGLFQWPSVELALLSIINGAAASGDIIGLLLIGLQIPRLAVVRNRGWRSYWKVKEEMTFKESI